MSDINSPEEKLLGGNIADSVVRAGSTVRKPATRATSAVHMLLAHLHRISFEGSPQPLGLDAQGRQILEYVPGAMWDKQNQSSLADLCKVGRLIRSLHDAVTSFTIVESAPWEPLSVPDGADILCHNDLAPWNLVCGTDRWVFIDWDNAAPGTRLWDLAWAAITFPPIEPDCDLAVAATAIRALVDGYRLQPAQYGQLLRLMAQRAGACSDLLVDGARTERQPWARLHAEGHNQYWAPVADYIGSHASTLEQLLTSLRPEKC